MKTFKILFAFLLLVSLTFQSCKDDITELDDPRDGISKLWRVTEKVSGRNYDVTITKHATEKTKVLMTGFHDLGAVTTDKLEATMAGTTLTIAKQTLNGEYTIEGTGVLTTDGTRIEFDYTIDDGDGPEDFGCIFGDTYVKKNDPILALK